MPTSNLAVWPALIDLIDKVPHERILDVGPGYGKAGILLREYLNDKPERIDAVEAWEPYITPRMEALYDGLYVGDVRNWSRDDFARYDVVLMSEVIEHMPKEDGHALLARIPGRVVISTPETFFENPRSLPPTEKHLSLWSVVDFGDRVEVDASQLGGVIVRLAPLDER